jgi:glycosyltransferase involved in cell wall biosynthesis
MRVHQINLQQHFGGGEVYTAFLCKAFDQLGIATDLHIHGHADFWGNLSLPKTTRLFLSASPQALESEIEPAPSWFLGHGPLSKNLCEKIHAVGGLATAIAHMPVQGRNPDVFQNHDQVLGVSQWVVDGLTSAGLPVWPSPLYGVANLERAHQKTPLIRRSRYDWDLRKGRDRIFSWIEPWIDPLLRHPPFERRNGLTLGIVSRITPIKQFPLLFEHLAPVLARFPDVNLEIFGSGGYGSVRDITNALKPIADRTRFWGHQSDVASVYQSIDYLLTGLPEKEALGLNVIEAQACGTPVLAPNAPPFTETVIDGATGFLYRDPRTDNGADFGRLIERLIALPARPDPLQAAEHLNKFAFASFVARLRPVVEWVQAKTTEVSK